MISVLNLRFNKSKGLYTRGLHGGATTLYHCVIMEPSTHDAGGAAGGASRNAVAWDLDLARGSPPAPDCGADLQRVCRL